MGGSQCGVAEMTDAKPLTQDHKRQINRKPDRGTMAMLLVVLLVAVSFLFFGAVLDLVPPDQTRLLP